MALWLTAGGPRTNAQSYALLGIQQHNSHNRTLNYSLCKINMFLAVQTRGQAGKVGKNVQREEEEVAVEGSYLHFSPYWIQGTLFSCLSSWGLEAGLLWQNDSDSCGSPIITFPFNFVVVDILHLQLGEGKKTNERKDTYIWYLNNVIPQHFL